MGQQLRTVVSLTGDELGLIRRALSELRAVMARDGMAAKPQAVDRLNRHLDEAVCGRPEGLPDGAERA